MLFIALIVAMQGVYKRQNVKKLITDMLLKWTTLLSESKLNPTNSSTSPTPTLFIIPILLTISSFATNPASNALTAPHSPNPKGSNIGAINCANVCNMLVSSSPFSMKFSFSVKLCKNHITTEKTNIYPPTLDKKCPAHQRGQKPVGFGAGGR